MLAKSGTQYAGAKKLWHGRVSLFQGETVRQKHHFETAKNAKLRRQKRYGLCGVLE
jgi:hypothetical protein